jgi:hypothetical protein
MPRNRGEVTSKSAWRVAGMEAAMPRPQWICLLSAWPGLPQIWTGRETSGIVRAGGFAVLLNATLLAGFVWPGSMPAGVAQCLWGVVAAVWCESIIETAIWVWRSHPDRFREEIEACFRAGQQAMLRGEWRASRDQFERVLQLDCTDCDAALYLAGICRRLGDFEAWCRLLERTRSLEGGKKWAWELERELSRPPTGQRGCSGRFGPTAREAALANRRFA